MNKERKRRPCAGLWNTPTVHVSGILTTCCLDTELKNRLGNIKDEPLSHLWNQEKIHRWRLAQIEGDFDKSGPACSTCNFESAGFYPEEKIIRYLEEKGEFEVLKRYLEMIENERSIDREK